MILMLLLVLCLLVLPEEEWSSLQTFSITALSASWIEVMQYWWWCWGSCWSPEEEESSSPVMNKTFFTRPPRVVISALRVLRWRDLRVLMICGRRSDLSSQQSEALITNFPSSSDASTSTDSSSSSVGTGLTSAINVVCRFSSFTCWITSASNDALSVYQKTWCKNDNLFFHVMQMRRWA